MPMTITRKPPGVKPRRRQVSSLRDYRFRYGCAIVFDSALTDRDRVSAAGWLPGRRHWLTL